MRNQKHTKYKPTTATTTTTTTTITTTAVTNHRHAITSYHCQPYTDLLQLLLLALLLQLLKWVLVELTVDPGHNHTLHQGNDGDGVCSNEPVEQLKQVDTTLHTDGIMA